MNTGKPSLQLSCKLGFLAVWNAALYSYASVWKLVNLPTSWEGISALAASMAFTKKAMLRPRLRIVWRPSRSASTSAAVKPCTSFQ